MPLADRVVGRGAVAAESWADYFTAMAEISTLTSRGSRATCTVARAGGDVWKYVP